MIYLICSLFVLGAIYAAVSHIRNKRLREQGRVEDNPDVYNRPDGCCGRHDVCERDSPIASFKKTDYYDDEELDRFKGVASDEYAGEAVDEFREVLYTLREIEVADWLRSLHLREIHLPDSLKDEALLIVSEQRMQR